LCLGKACEIPMVLSDKLKVFRNLLVMMKIELRVPQQNKR